MAIFHIATLAPTKAELIATWAPTQPWGPPPDDAIEVIGSYRFDDPDGLVGMETFLVSSGGALLQIPLSYRAAPLAGADLALITTMEHSVLGPRWVYDGLGDPQFVVMLAAVALTGQGVAIGMSHHDDRWHISPSKLRVQGGGWTQGWAPVDRFVLTSDATSDPASDPPSLAVLENDRFQLNFSRRPQPGTLPAIGLAATWDAQPQPVVLAEVRERATPTN